jgi:sugar lactone lactonase YvrE
MDEPRVFRESEQILGESLVWRDGVLWWTDISSGVLHSSRGGSLALGPPLASFGIADDGWIASFGDSVGLVSSGGDVSTLARIPHRHAGMRLNEGKVDPAGRWVTGSMELTRSDDPDAAFYSIDGTGDVRVLVAGLGVANGLEWSPDGSTIYFTDTSVETIYAAPYSPSGELGEVTVFHSGEPHDGLVMDVDGCLWSSLYGKGLVVRYAPTGDELQRIELPAPNLTSGAFGGDGLSTLFVASARENLTEEQLAHSPLSGSIFAIDTDTGGRLPNRFRSG